MSDCTCEAKLIDLDPSPEGALWRCPKCLRLYRVGDDNVTGYLTWLVAPWWVRLREQARDRIRPWVEGGPIEPDRPPAVSRQDLTFTVTLEADKVRAILDKALREHVKNEVDSLAKSVAASFLFDSEEGQALVQTAYEVVRRYPAAGLDLEQQITNAVASALMKSFQR